MIHLHQAAEFRTPPSVRIFPTMDRLLARRLAAPMLAAALVLAPALRLVCDTVCAQPPAASANHCAEGGSSQGSPSQHEPPNGCRHADEVVLAKTFALAGAVNAASVALSEIVPFILFAPPASHATDQGLHRRSRPSAAAHAPAVLRL